MRVLNAFLVVIVLAGTSLGQGFPDPKPGPEQKVLAKDVGTWKGKVKMFLQGPDGPPTVYEGTETNQLISGDLFLKSEFQCKMGDRQFEGHGILGFDASKERYTGVWVDNFTSAPTHMTATYDKAKRTMVTRSTIIDDSGNELLQKQVTTWAEDEKSKVFSIFLIINDGDKEVDVKLMEMEAKKT